MKKVICVAIIALSILGYPSRARADFFGGDVVVLTQILTQAVMQLAKLRELLGTAQANYDLIREINQGINDSLSRMRNINPNTDPGIYRDWDTVQEALQHVQGIYGTVAPLPRPTCKAMWINQLPRPWHSIMPITNTLITSIKSES